MANRWHLAAAVVSAGAIGSAGLMIGVLATDRRSATSLAAQQSGDEVTKVAASIAARAEQAMMAEVTSAAAIPQLRAALRNRVDAATIEDLFTTEDWWTPYRDRSAAVVTAGGSRVAHPARQIMPETEIAARARTEGTISVVKQSAGVAKVVAAAVIEDVPGSPVLTLARPLDAALVSEWARTAGVSLAVTDGQRVVATSDEDFGRLALVGHERDQTFPRDARQLAVPSALGGGLWLWVARALPPAVDGRTWIWGAVAAALAVAAGLALIGGRRKPAAPAAPVVDTRSWQPVEMDPIAPHRLTGGANVRQIRDRGPQLTTSGTMRKFGRYELLERIAEGGMSDIYTAAMRGAQGFERILVIKRLKRELSGNRAAVEQFIDEARLGSQLVHPNIAQVYDFGDLEDGYFMALEYVPGRNVIQIVERHVERMSKALDLASVFYLAHDVLQALGYAHYCTNANGGPLGVVHRDVSPANVMINPRGDVKLLDFGIVKAEDRISRSDIKNVKGNPAFMSPEQARGMPVDARSDLFSVGLVMYYALTGETVYRVGNPGETLFQAATGPSREQMQGVFALAEPAASVIARALAAAPDERFQTAEEFAAALAPEIRQGARASMGTLMQTLFGYDFQLDGSAGVDRNTPLRPRAV